MNSQREEELKPCPFCGSESISTSDPELKDDRRYWEASVTCDNCDAGVTSACGYRGNGSVALNEAISSWNTRQAATEQGVGEPVAWWNGEGRFTRHPDMPEKHYWEKVIPLYTHPPKPTGGGMPELDDSEIPRSFDFMMARAYRVGFEDCRAALLATQQPPEKD